jgi:predicted GNAT family acetyltransferase
MEANMNFKYETNRIYLEDAEGKVIAEVTYPDVNEQLVNINHTFVDDTLRGQGIAGMLMEAAAAQLKKENKRAVLTCSYAVKWFEKNEQYKELIKKID